MGKRAAGDGASVGTPITIGDNPAGIAITPTPRETSTTLVATPLRCWTPGLFALAAMERELEATIGRRVDLRTYHDLSRYFRDDVVASARVVYAA